jgi:hypothetical protein
VNLSNLELNTPAGTQTTLGEHIDRPTVVVLVRYFG